MVIQESIELSPKMASVSIAEAAPAAEGREVMAIALADGIIQPAKNPNPEAIKTNTAMDDGITDKPQMAKA